MKRTKAEYIAAIKAARGLITVAARSLGVEFSAVYGMAKRHPEVKQAIEDSREQMLDFAESKLFENMKANDNTALIFFLKTQGRKRGYNENYQPQETNETLAALVEAIKEARK